MGFAVVGAQSLVRDFTLPSGLARAAFAELLRKDVACWSAVVVVQTKIASKLSDLIAEP